VSKPDKNANEDIQESHDCAGSLNQLPNDVGWGFGCVCQFFRGEKKGPSLRHTFITVSWKLIQGGVDQARHRLSIACIDPDA
jgi:hypothetical protein